MVLGVAARALPPQPCTVLEPWSVAVVVVVVVAMMAVACPGMRRRPSWRT